MLLDRECAVICWNQYHNKGSFDYSNRIEQVSYAVQHYPNCEVVCCEGSFNAPDWWSNIQFLMVRIPNLGCVEHGFNTGTEDTVNDLIPRIDKNKVIKIIGHSRGGSHARIIAARLKNLGYNVNLVAFESPHTGDADFEALVETFPNVTYRNYKSFDEQDIVCAVPFFDPILCKKYATPKTEVIFDQPPMPNDPWGILGRHHLELDIKELSK